jgi:hypothetical protein
MIHKVFKIIGRVLIILLAAGLVTLILFLLAGQSPQVQFPGSGDGFIGNPPPDRLEGGQTLLPRVGGLHDGSGRGLHGGAEREGGAENTIKNFAIIAGITLAVALIKWLWGLTIKRKAVIPNQT